jgi:hypothetical protein
MASRLSSLAHAKAFLAELTDGLQVVSLALAQTCLAEDGLQVAQLVPGKGLSSGTI